MTATKLASPLYLSTSELQYPRLAQPDCGPLGDKMATKRKEHPALPIKDEEDEHPIPLAWRSTLRQVVSAFAKGDYQLACGVSGVAPVSAEQAKQFQDYLVDYGAELVDLPDATWTTSVTQWYDPHWGFLLDLWTAEEGSSDLVLSGTVSETPEGFRFTLELVYVP